MTKIPIFPFHEVYRKETDGAENKNGHAQFSVTVPNETNWAVPFISRNFFDVCQEAKG